MSDSLDPLAHLLVDVILPNLKAVQASQSEQIAANDQLEQAIEELQLHMKSQFAHLSAQLTACRAEIAALHATLKATQSQSGLPTSGRTTLIH